MRKYIVIYLFFIAFSFNVFADNSEDIKLLIKKIQSANVENRRELINQLKLKLRKKNKKNQKEAIMKLKESFRRGRRGRRGRWRCKNKINHHHRHHRYFRSHR